MPGEGGFTGAGPSSRVESQRPGLGTQDRTRQDRSPWPRREEVRHLSAELPIQAVALDVDGTLLQADLRVTRRTRMSVRALRAQGIRVIIATGRRIGTASRYGRAAGAGPTADIVALDGALVTEAGGRHALRTVAIEAESARQILGWAEDLGLAFVVNTRTHLYGTPGQASRQVIREHHRRGIFRTFSGALHTLWEIPPLKPWGQLDPRREGMLKFSPLGPREATAALRERIERADLPVHLTTPGGPYYEIVARGISKGEGLSWLLGERGVSAEHTLAIGDGWNDVQMFLRVGHSVAMGNAPSGVKGYARWVTLSVDEGGVAEVLERVAAGNWPPLDGAAEVREEPQPSFGGSGPDSRGPAQGGGRKAAGPGGRGGHAADESPDV